MRILPTVNQIKYMLFTLIFQVDFTALRVANTDHAIIDMFAIMYAELSITMHSTIKMKHTQQCYEDALL